MLRALTISNVVLIEKLEIDFRSGLCALTGETGAGKSILLDSLGLALGVRAESRLVRKGAEQAVVSASFDIAPEHPARRILQETDILVDGGEDLILKRTLSSDGRSKAIINDQPVSAALLRQVGDALVEIHGQFDTHSLLDSARHIGLLDEYAGLGEKAAQLKTLWQEWRAAESALREAEENAEKLREEEEYLRHVVEELTKLAPEEGEEAHLASLKTSLQNRDQIVEALNAAHGFLTAEGSADAMIQKAYRVIGRSEDKIGPVSAEIMEAMDRASAELDTARNIIDSTFADMEGETARFEDVDDRLYALRSAARKHECAVDGLGQKLEELKGQLSNVEAQDDILSDLAAQANKAGRAYEELALEVSDIRAEAAENLDGEVMKELGPLKLDKARFVTSLAEKPRENWNEEGLDQVAFLIATNPGAEPGRCRRLLRAVRWRALCSR